MLVFHGGTKHTASGGPRLRVWEAGSKTFVSFDQQDDGVDCCCAVQFLRSTHLYLFVCTHLRKRSPRYLGLAGHVV